MKKSINYIAGIMLLVFLISSLSVALKITNNFKTSDKAIVRSNYQEMIKSIRKKLGLPIKHKIYTEGKQSKIFYEMNNNSNYLEYKEYYDAQLEDLINRKKIYYSRPILEGFVYETFCINSTISFWSLGENFARDDKNRYYFYFYIRGFDNIGYNGQDYRYFRTFFFLKLHPEQEKRVKGISGIGTSDISFYLSAKSFNLVIDSPLYYSRFFNVMEA